MAASRAARGSAAGRSAPVTETRWGRAAVAAGLVVVALAVFAPALQGSFLWDDAEILSRNPDVRAPDGLAAMWSRPRAVAHVPLTTTMFWVEWRLWGERPLGYHVVNVLLHAGAAFLVWRILRRLAVPGALAAAAVFLVHPVTVASVAWIAERKNTLSLVLFAGALLAYLRFDDGEGRRWYGVAVVVFLLALLAKPAVVMLPIVVLGAAWGRRGTLTRVDLMPVLPLLALSLVLGMATVYEHPLSATRGADLRPEGPASRMAAAGWVVWFYLAKALAPVDLAMVYPRWHVDPQSVAAWLPLVALAGLLAAAWWFRRGWGRACLAGLGYVVVVLVPVLGLVPMSFHRHSLVSDHLQYLALPGTVALAVGMAARVLRPRVPRAGRTMLALLSVAVLAAGTWQRAHVFASSRALWEDTARRHPDVWVAQSNLGLALLEAGELERAATHIERAVRLDRTAPESAVNLGRVLEERGQYEDARVQYLHASRLAPDRPEPLNNLGEVLRKLGDPAGAMTAYEAALRIEPGFAEAHNNLGVVLAERGRAAEAEPHYREALRLRPDYAEAHTNLGNLLLGRGRVEEALEHHRAALLLRPAAPELQNNLATVLTTQGRHAEAIEHYRAALAMRPERAEIHHNLATSLAALGRLDEAIRHYEEAVRLAPAQAASQQALADARARRAGR